ncbi:hypothetical protein AJ79_03363 [Helicocarpus griseus UAMH5409]|uniref:FAD-binding PCMH-type domain-containing protein n=1 Tax=Helicocarpus griseus UAMH5409 TaxID=1447875 RepID=A0A2B7XZF2_9EURO|nr:hypothetical protein AJ79_03363 [Helicocarpus griseus UAMH5409]
MAVIPTMSSSSAGLLAGTLFLLGARVHAQQSPPAVAVVPADSVAGAPLFEAETIQLTDEVVRGLKDREGVSELAHLFAFDDDPEGESLTPAGGCKVFPGDKEWPSDSVWDIFNELLGGGESPYNNYDAEKCARILEEWTVSELHTSDPGSGMYPIYQGKTCMPSFANVSTCTQGGYSTYAVKVTNTAQIQLALNFARATNIRLVPRNTGHDYNGKSMGAGALSVWMHHLKDIEFIPDYSTEWYEGPAMKVGAGVQVFEIYEAADKHDVTAVGGVCPTVGFTGGYLAGGGHSPMMPVHGMATDQVVALEVITADGRHVTATPAYHSDLFWALNGGGGSTFGIVTSAIVKVHPKIPVTTSVINFKSSDTVSRETFWAGVRAYWDEKITYNNAQTYSYYWLRNSSGNYSFDMGPFFAPNHTIDQFTALTKPWFDKLTALGIPFTAETKYHESFLAAYDATIRNLNHGVGSFRSLPGVRLFPTSNWATEEKRTATLSAIQAVVEEFGTVGAYHQAPRNPEKIINSVNPAFRTEAAFIIGSAPAPENATAEQLQVTGERLTNEILGPWKEVAPQSEGAGSYMNEASVVEQEWQKEFWGANYERLLEVKRKWDPKEVFYAHHAVGTEGWEVRDGDVGPPTQNGRLCRVVE